MLLATGKSERSKDKDPAASWKPPELQRTHQIPGLGNSGTWELGLKGAMVYLPPSSSPTRTLATAPPPNILGGGWPTPSCLCSLGPSLHARGSPAPARWRAALGASLGTLDKPRGGTPTSHFPP